MQVARDLAQLAIQRGDHFLRISADGGVFRRLVQIELARLVEHVLHIGGHVVLVGLLAAGQPQAFQLVEALEAFADGAVVGERAAQPALADVGHMAARRFALNGLLRLAFGADEEHEAAAGGDLGEEAVGAEQAAHGLAQIDYVDEVTLAVDELAHLRVPATGPVPEMHA